MSACARMLKSGLMARSTVRCPAMTTHASLQPLLPDRSSSTLSRRPIHQCCAGDPEAEDAPTPLQAALPSTGAYQHIRALPCAAGAAVIFTHRLIHWGSAASRSAVTPRVAMSFVFSDPDFEVRRSVITAMRAAARCKALSLSAAETCSCATLPAQLCALA